MKWTKQLNIDIIRCYYNTILRIQINLTKETFTLDGQLYIQKNRQQNREFVISRGW